VSRRID
jgi:DnaJ-class molecular chaperone